MKYLSQHLAYNKFPINTIADSDDVADISIPPTSGRRPCGASEPEGPG